MLTTDGRTLELVRKAFAAEVEKTRDAIEYGQPHVVSDFAIYQRHVGFIAGLRFLETALTEARQQAEQEAGQPPRAA
jgi:hypothetical protein